MSKVQTGPMQPAQRAVHTTLLRRECRDVEYLLRSGTGAWAVVVVGVLGFLVTVIGSWVPSYWNDEAATLRLARLSLPDIVRFVEHKDAVHAVYALFMHGWIQLFGESELATRLPSALAVGAACSAVLVLTRRLGHPEAAATAAVIMLLLPRVMSNGMEARSYAIATALIAWAAVWAVTAALRGRWWRWGLFALLLAVATAVFLYAALVAPALVIPLFLRTSHRGRGIAAFLTSSLAAGVVVSPLALLAVSQGGQIAWLSAQPVNPYTVGIESFFLSSWWFALFSLTLLLTWFLMRRRAVWSVAMLTAVAWLAIPTVALLTATIAIGPMFTPRYLSVCTPAFATLIAIAITSWRQRTAAILVIAAVVLALPTAITLRTTVAKPGGQNLREVAQVIRSNARPSDGFLLANTGPVTLRPRLVLAAYPSAFDRLDDLAFSSSYKTTGTYSDRLLDSEAISDLELRTARLWIVTRNDQPQPGSGPRALLRNGYQRDGLWHVTGMTVTLWDRNG